MPEPRLIWLFENSRSLLAVRLRPRNAISGVETSQIRPSCKCNEIDSGAFITLIMLILR